MSPALLAQQLAQLSLTFDDAAIAALNHASKCNAIEGVVVSQEELEALKEAANAQADAPEEDLKQMDQLDKLDQEMGALNLNSKKPDSFVKPQQTQQQSLIGGTPDIKMPMNDPFSQKDPFKSGGGLQNDPFSQKDPFKSGGGLQ